MPGGQYDIATEWIYSIINLTSDFFVFSLTESTSAAINCSTKRQITFGDTEHINFKFISKTGILDRSKYKPHDFHLLDLNRILSNRYFLIRPLRSQDCNNYHSFKQKGIIKKVVDFGSNKRYVNTQFMINIIYRCI